MQFLAICKPTFDPTSPVFVLFAPPLRDLRGVDGQHQQPFKTQLTIGPLETKRMTLESDAVASATIELLESRLRRLSYLLTGDSHWTGEPSLPLKPDNLDETVSRRLFRLEKDLERLSRNIPAIYDVIQLRTPSPTPHTFPLTDH